MADGALSRRSLLTGAVVAVAGGVAGFAVARASSLAKTPTTPTAGPNGYGTPPSPSAGAELLVAVSKVPIGGGVVLASKSVVVTRTPAGVVHGFSAICTHLGCTVATVQGGVIQCPCHGSEFNAFTGAVVRGPAARPLPAVAVAVRAGEVYRGT